MSNGSLDQKCALLWEALHSLTKRFCFPKKHCVPLRVLFYPETFQQFPYNSFVSPWESLHSLLQVFWVSWETVHLQKIWFPQKTLHVFAKLLHFSQETLCSPIQNVYTLPRSFAFAHKSFDTEAANTNIFFFPYIYFTVCP